MLFEALTMEDRAKIENWITLFGATNGTTCGTRAELSYILRHWNRDKERLFQLFGNKFILEKSVQYGNTPNELSRQIAGAMCQEQSGLHLFHEAVMLHDIAKEWTNYANLCKLFESYNLAHNRIKGRNNETYVISYNDTEIKFQHDSKPIKVLSKVAQLCGLEESFEKFRLEHSQILNQKSLIGSLCLSIHPLDFMTMSDNASNWSSCMSWREAGCYRAGTVEMMNSPCVVVAYLKSDNRPMQYKDFEWNNKHWRCLFIVDSNVITSVKSYPYENNDFTMECLEWLRQLAYVNWNQNYFTEPVKVIDNDVRVTVPGTKDTAVRLWFETDVMYNDFGSTTSYALLNEKCNGSFVHINYSGERNCMCCGDYLDMCGDEPEQFVFCDYCEDHENYYTCEECGERVCEDDIYWLNGMPYCSCCFSNVAFECPIYRDYYHNYDGITVRLAREEDNPNETDLSVQVHYAFAHNRTVASHYYGASLVNDEANIKKTDEGIYYFNMGDLTLRGFSDLFGLYNWGLVEDYRNAVS